MGYEPLMLLAVVPAWVKPLWLIGAGALAATAAMAVVYLGLRLVFPRVAAVADTTAREGMFQPLFYVLLAVGAAALLLFTIIPYNTLGDDIKMVKDSGLTLIMVISVFLAVWNASSSVAEEIEGRVAVTVLSKPIGRREFLIGKFLGILGPVAIVFIVLGAVFLSTVSFKVPYDARESASPEPKAEDCYKEVAEIAPGLALAMMETVVLASIGLAISTRLPMVPNLVICLAVYALGHLMPTLVWTASQGQAIPAFMAEFFATILPMLDAFNMSTAIFGGKEIPYSYLGMAGLYCLVYTTVALLVGLLLFENRDLA